jgi:hypothetical protein
MLTCVIKTHMLRSLIKKFYLGIYVIHLFDINYFILFNAKFLYLSSLSCALRVHVNKTLKNMFLQFIRPLKYQNN